MGDQHKTQPLLVIDSVSQSTASTSLAETIAPSNPKSYAEPIESSSSNPSTPVTSKCEGNRFSNNKQSVRQQIEVKYYRN